MSEVFDPYYKWLGIKPEDQPPNHYRLLGIDLFENDPEVIDAAASRQMAHVRSYQLGPHLALSQKLLNEIAAAKVCLLNPSKKDGYDAKLKTELAAGAAEADLSPIYDILSPSSADVAVPASHQPIRRRAMPISLVMTFASLAVILCFVMGALTLSSIGKREPAGTDGTGQSPPRAIAMEPVREPSSAGGPAWQPSPQASPPTTTAAVPPPAPATPILAPSPTSSVESKRPTGKETLKEITAFAQDTPTKAPIPDATAQGKATALVRELYKEKFDAATTVQQKRALAVELLSKAKATQDDLPARYMLLKEARSFSVTAGDIKTALQVVDEMDRTFQIDTPKMKLAILNALQTTWKTEGRTTKEEPGVKSGSAPPRDSPPASNDAPIEAMAKEPAIAGTPAERRAAEWILKVKGQVEVVANRHRSWVKQLTDLPQTPFTVVVVKLTGNRSFADDDLAVLAPLTHVESLRLGGTRVSDKGLVHFQHYTKLTHLELNWTNVTGKGLSNFANARLRDFDASGLRNAKIGIRFLRSLGTLKGLSLNRSDVTTESLADLMAMTTLRMLFIADTRLPPQAMQELKAALPQCRIMN